MSRAMVPPIMPPDDCQTMAEVRIGVDDVDRRLIALLTERFAYMRAAARIKPERTSVRDEARKAQIIAAVEAQARAAELPAERIREIWDRLVEASIAYEMAEWERLRP